MKAFYSFFSKKYACEIQPYAAAFYNDFRGLSAVVFGIMQNDRDFETTTPSETEIMFQIVIICEIE